MRKGRRKVGERGGGEGAVVFCNLNFFYRESFHFVNPTNQNFLTSKIPTICHSILVTLPGTLLEMQLHYSQSSRENATPSSGTSPLAH